MWLKCRSIIMWRIIFVICLIISCNWISWITADVSHLKSLSASKTTNDNHHHHFSAFNGYDYNPPTLPSPAPYPYPPSSTTFLPEIIVNKGIRVETISMNKNSVPSHCGSNQKFVNWNKNEVKLDNSIKFVIFARLYVSQSFIYHFNYDFIFKNDMFNAAVMHIWIFCVSSSDSFFHKNNGRNTFLVPEFCWILFSNKYHFQYFPLDFNCVLCSLKTLFVLICITLKLKKIF